jgi:nucleoside diphosphate kinase
MRRLLLAAAPLLFLNAQPESCPLHMLSPRDAQAALYHSVAVTTEAVAGGRRHASNPPATAVTPPAQPSDNVIDADVFAKLKALNIPATSLSTDEEFLRRVTLDLTGQIPDPAAVTAFLNDATPGKRTKKIDELLASDAFADRWTLWFGDLVQNVQVADNSREFYEGRNAYYQWIRQSIKDGKPYDAMVRELLAGKGDSFAAGTPNYVVRQLQPNGPPQDTLDNLATHSGEKFLGMPLLCLSCHNGPGHLEQVNSYLATKKRAELWSMSAFFANIRVQNQPGGDPNNPNARKYLVDDTNVNGRYLLNTTSGNKTQRNAPPGQPNYAVPAFILTGEQPRSGEVLREAYGRMLTSDRQFARATVNYLWKELFAVAIVEPVNNIDPNKLQTQATNPALLEDLTQSFIGSGYNLRALLRLITTSTAYQLSSRYTSGTWNESWTPYYARHAPRRLAAEMLFDAMIKATGVAANFNVNGIGAVTKAMQLPDTTEGARNANGRFLDEFGRGNRDDVIRSNDASIAQSLSLMNDTVVTQRVKRSTPNSTVGKTLAATSDPGAIVDALYLATLSRRPNAVERQTAIAYLGTGDIGRKSEDLQFALLNSLEFLFN